MASSTISYSGGGITFTKCNITAETTFNIPNNYRGTLYVYDSATARCGEYLVYAASTGGVNMKAISVPSDISLVGGTNKLTVTPSAGNRALLFINVNGGAVTT